MSITPTSKSGTNIHFDCNLIEINNPWNMGFYDPQSTDGQTTITATVVPFSGGECNLGNNSDSELLIYFK